MPEMLINPRHAQPGSRQNDMRQQQLEIRMQKLEKSNQELLERLAALEAKRPVGRPPKAADLTKYDSDFDGVSGRPLSRTA